MQATPKRPRWTRAGFAALVVGVLAASSWMTAPSAFVTLDGDRTKWTSNPSYRILNSSSDVSDGSDLTAVRQAFQTWEDVPGASITFREVSQGGDMTVEFTSDWPAEVGEYAAGVTYTFRQGGQITEAQILINERSFEWSTDGDPDKTDIQGVMVHEIGHGIGLGHSRERAAVMYWSGGGADLRELDPDDVRGVTFLYGNGAGQGLLCDTCLSNADCANGGVCVGLEPTLAFCGVPCGRNFACPEGTACYGLQDSDESQCFPETQFCSDDGGGGIGAGEYCWGAAQCANGLECVAIPDGEAQCAGSCQDDGDCPNGQRCFGAEANRPGLCLGGGEGAFGDPCESDLDCAEVLCLPISDTLSVCAAECDPARSACEVGGSCIAVDDIPGLEGICVPPGDVDEGGACGGDDRCGPDLTCILETDDAGACRAACDPFGDCARNRGCTPFGDDQWFCLPTANLPTEGEPCDDGQCGGGLACLEVSDGDERCFRLCPDDDPDAPCGQDVGCLDIDGNDGNLGICSFGEANFGDACERAAECASFTCVTTDDGGACSRECDTADNACPEGWECLRSQSGRLCFPTDEPANNSSNNANNANNTNNSSNNANNTNNSTNNENNSTNNENNSTNNTNNSTNNENNSTNNENNSTNNENNSSNNSENNSSNNSENNSSNNSEDNSSNNNANNANNNSDDNNGAGGAGGSSGGCQTAPASPSGLGWLAFAALWLARRRRAPRAQEVSR